LIAEPLAQGLQASVPAHIREVVEAVSVLSEMPNQSPAGLSDVATLLGKDISSVSRNVQTAIRERYLEDQNPGRGRRSMLVLGERELPAGTVLPDPIELSEAMEGGNTAVSRKVATTIA
jgi:hypothetical protein